MFVYTIQPVVKPYNRLSNRFHNRLYRVYEHSTGCQTGCLTTGWTNSGCSFNTVVKPVVQPVWQPVVSCKRGIMVLQSSAVACLYSPDRWASRTCKSWIHYIRIGGNIAHGEQTDRNEHTRNWVSPASVREDRFCAAWDCLTRWTWRRPQGRCSDRFYDAPRARRFGCSARPSRTSRGSLYSFTRLQHVDERYRKMHGFTKSINQSIYLR